MGNRFALRFTWLLVKAAEYMLPLIWKILVAAFYLILAFTAVIVVMIIL